MRPKTKSAIDSWVCREIKIVREPYKDPKRFVKSCEQVLRSIFGEDFKLEDVIVTPPLPCSRENSSWTCYYVPDEIVDELREKGEMSAEEILEKTGRIGYSSGDFEVGWKECFECSNDVLAVIYAYYCERALK